MRVPSGGLSLSLEWSRAAAVGPETYCAAELGAASKRLILTMARLTSV